VGDNVLDDVEFDGSGFDPLLDEVLAPGGFDQFLEQQLLKVGRYEDMSPRMSGRPKTISSRSKRDQGRAPLGERSHFPSGEASGAKVAEEGGGAAYPEAAGAVRRPGRHRREA
jgi:hypothetical protein